MERIQRLANLGRRGGKNDQQRMGVLPKRTLEVDGSVRPVEDAPASCIYRWRKKSIGGIRGITPLRDRKTRKKGCITWQTDGEELQPMEMAKRELVGRLALNLWTDVRGRLVTADRVRGRLTGPD